MFSQNCTFLCWACIVMDLIALNITVWYFLFHRWTGNIFGHDSSSDLKSPDPKCCFVHSLHGWCLTCWVRPALHVFKINYYQLSCFLKCPLYFDSLPFWFSLIIFALKSLFEMFCSCCLPQRAYCAQMMAFVAVQTLQKCCHTIRSQPFI